MSTAPYGDERSEIGEDALDLHVGSRDLREVRLIDLLGRTRAALGLRPLTAPALLFVPLGAALGPAGLGWVPAETLGHLYPVVAIALAAIGVFVGFGVTLDHARERRLLALASLEALITIVIVAAACAGLFASWQIAERNTLVLPLVLGVCASATAVTLGIADGSPLRNAALRIADLDDVLPIALGGAILALSTGRDLATGAMLALLGFVVPLTVALAGWLLFERAHDAAERNVFVIGSTALLGGTAAYLGVSPLFAGMAAGVFWRYSPGHADTIIRDDLRRIQHPLVVLLLIFAGAAMQITYLALWLAGAYVMTRLCGKLLGGWIVSRATPTLSPGDLGSYLLPPGVIGLAFALSFHLAALSVTSSAVLTAVALGTLASELIAAAALLGPERRA